MGKKPKVDSKGLDLPLLLKWAMLPISFLFEFLIYLGLLRKIPDKMCVYVNFPKLNKNIPKFKKVHKLSCL